MPLSVARTRRGLITTDRFAQNARSGVGATDGAASKVRTEGRRMPIHETQIFRSSLLEHPKIYRDIEIASSLSLYRLAKAIVTAYDFDFDHCFGFYPNTNRAKFLRATPAYELFADIGEETDALSVKKTTVATAFRQPNHTILFLFDYGDGWLFRIESLR